MNPIVKQLAMQLRMLLRPHAGWYALIAWGFSNERWYGWLQERSVWFERAFGVVLLGLAARLVWQTVTG